MADVKTRVAPPQDPPSDVKRRGFGICLPALMPAAIATVLLLPFLRRAFSIDDPLFIWIAEHILKHPFNPYGFSVNWSIMQGRMWQLMQNPPLDSYFIAAVVRIAGLSETALHTAFLLPAIAVASGTYLLARRFCSRPIEAAFAAILTPAFLVCGSTVMCDMMMVAFWVWAVHFWVKGMDDSRPSLIALSCVLITLSALSKYYGAVLLPMLLAYSLLARRKPGWWMLGCLIPIIALVAYHFWTKSLYGRGLMLDAFTMSGQYRNALGAALIPKTVVGFAFAGGCLASVIFHAPLLWSRKALAGWIGAAVVLIAAFGLIGSAGSHSLKMAGPDCWRIAAHLGPFVAAGLSLLALAVLDLLANRDADSALLFLWLAGTLVFVSILNWTVNGRVLLPAAPVAGIIMMRRIERRASGGGHTNPSFVVPWVLSALLAFAVAYADQQFANSQRIAAGYISKDFHTKGTMWFQGHWGFQYYIQRRGAKPIAYHATPFRVGDTVVSPVNNTSVGPPPAGATVATGEFPGSRWLSTMNKLRRTAFHSDVWGPIPYGFGLTSPEYYYITPLDQRNLAILLHRKR